MSQPKKNYRAISLTIFIAGILLGALAALAGLTRNQSIGVLIAALSIALVFILFFTKRAKTKPRNTEEQ
ncbi:hypothetical protein [Kribbella sp. ALI-6-A]|uniref:hypothetical protein n=1 Tax=Kribbella sp. ALI-6-A TaxID=1933817 RepID=UPI00117A8819|nr:hypothetical protein [Kribbella sp. ALI-6-A]